ncbi:hypothetical protein MLD38_003917 [Melastoma candidum]|uniref:Uncharacterized protein n=1 Tax=Melastoma candidum TaxID=119954 RepID=A0ACB9S3Y5_9MYRT|nr:hypothetical protein MLD38_003917 [Melastoma candidum]
MGKKLDRLLGRGFRASKFKTLLKLVVSRVVIQRNRCRVHVSQYRSDVTQLLMLGHHDQSLVRVEQVIRELNMLDAYAMIEGYCILLAERVDLIEREKFCPGELKEAMSSLIFAASRCGELPELHEVRRCLASRYGREFADQAVELRNGCAVSPKIIQKLSAKQPPLEIRTKLIGEIASVNGIVLPHEDLTSQKQGGWSGDSRRNVGMKRDQHAVRVGVNLGADDPRMMEFNDAVDAAQAAFDAAAYAAAAARAASQKWEAMAGAWLMVFPDAREVNATEVEFWIDCNRSFLPFELKSMERSELIERLLSVQNILRIPPSPASFQPSSFLFPSGSSITSPLKLMP